MTPSDAIVITGGVNICARPGVMYESGMRETNIHACPFRKAH